MAFSRCIRAAGRADVTSCAAQLMPRRSFAVVVGTDTASPKVEFQQLLELRRSHFNGLYDKAKSETLPWRFTGAMIVCRTPVLTPTLEPWEEKYYALDEKRETGRLSNYEKLVWPSYQDEDREFLEANNSIDGMAPGKTADEVTEVTSANIHDVPDTDKKSLSIEELLREDAAFDAEEWDREWDDNRDDAEGKEEDESALDGDGLAPRITEADKTNDRTTVNRRLTDNLYLLVKSKKWREGESPWHFPQGGKEASDSNLKETAIREVGEECGAWVQDAMYPVGNGPCGFHVCEFPVGHKHTTGYFGEKVFFFKSQVFGIEDPVIALNNSEIEEFAWVSRDELGAYIDDESLLHYFEVMLA